MRVRGTAPLERGHDAISGGEVALLCALELEGPSDLRKPG